MIRWNKGLCNNYLELGGGLGVWFGKLVAGGGIGENNSKREEGLDAKFNTYRGDYFFIPFCKLEK